MSDPNQDTRHERLIKAGWTYDPTSDRYRAPGSATDGTARVYDINAAFLELSSETTPMPPQAPQAPPRLRDPRQKEPE